LKLDEGECWFDECAGPSIANYYPDTTYGGNFEYGQLLQAAICVDQDCSDNYGSFHVGCKECTTEESPEDWEFCLDCAFE